MLGTGHAMVFACFNTCFVYENENGRLLVDSGGGNGLLLRLRQAGIDQSDIRAVFISHRHTDHICGLPWLFRSGPGMGEGMDFYLHPDVLRVAKGMQELLFTDEAERRSQNLRFHEIHDGEQGEILGRPVTFLDLHSPNVPQFGFRMTLESGGDFVFHGDVPFHEANRERLTGVKWLMHEAFHLSTETMGPPRGPGGKGGPGGPPPGGKGPGRKGGPGHSTVKQAAEYAKSLAAENLILVHGSDNDLETRKARYTAEARTVFDGPIYVPDDLDVIDLG